MAGHHVLMTTFLSGTRTGQSCWADHVAGGGRSPSAVGPTKSTSTSSRTASSAKKAGSLTGAKKKRQIAVRPTIHMVETFLETMILMSQNSPKVKSVKHHLEFEFYLNIYVYLFMYIFI